MRVSDRANQGVVQDNLHRSRSRLENLQTQVSTLKRVNRPSDDPVGAAKILEVRTDKVNNEQFQSNGKLAEALLNNTDHALQDLSEILMRAKEIAINQSSGASSTPETRIGVAEEVTQLYQQALAVGNRRIGDRFLFGGYRTNTAPFDREGKYLGDQGEMMVEIGREVYIGTNLPGSEVFNTQPQGPQNEVPSPRSAPSQVPEKNNQVNRTLASQDEESSPNINYFEELKALRVGLLTGDLNTIRGTLERFDDLQGKVIALRSKIGSRVQGIQGTISAHERHNITNAQLTSSIEDADMTQVVSDLAKEETVYKSTLASSKNLIQPTLLDFLR